jgi:hypothetical protein
MVVYHRLVRMPLSRVPPQKKIIEIDWQRSRVAWVIASEGITWNGCVYCSPQKVNVCVQRVTTPPESGGDTFLDDGGVRRNPVRVSGRVFHLQKK